jgi:hypothetical protein
MISGIPLGDFSESFQIFLQGGASLVSEYCDEIARLFQRTGAGAGWCCGQSYPCSQPVVDSLPRCRLVWPQVPTKMKFRHFLLAIAFLPSFFLAACSSGDPKGDTVMKLPDYYFLDPSLRIATGDDMVVFESRHHLHGAITREERSAREGHYYSFPWKTRDKTSDASLLFEYRQQNTGAEVHALRVPIDRVRRNNVTRVEIIGEPYQLNGKVSAWRATLERNGSGVVSKQSYLWE